MRVSPNGGKPEILISVRDDERVVHPQTLPGGGYVLFTLAKRPLVESTQWDKAQIVVQTLKTGARTTLVDGGTHGVYVPSGHLLYVLGGVLFGVPFDPARLQVTGEPAPVVEGVRRITAGRSEGASALYSVSDTGSLAFVPGPITVSTGRQVTLALADRKGNIEPLKLQPASYEAPRVSPDGKRVAVGTGDGKEASIWIYELSGTSAMRRLTIGGRNRVPIWSPDGERVAFQSDREGDAGIFWQRVDGNSPAERLTTAEKGTSHTPESWSPDGDHIMFSVTRGSNITLSVFSIRDRKATPFGGVQSSTPTNAAFSPDGRWVAYQSERTGNDRAFAKAPAPLGTFRIVFVQPFPATGATFQITRSEEDAHHPAWSRDGKELFYVPGPSQLAVRAIRTAPTFEVGDAMAIQSSAGRSFAAPGTSPTVQRNFDVTPDGRFVGFVAAGVAQSGPAGTPQIEVVINWFTELQQRVPSRASWRQ